MSKEKEILDILSLYESILKTKSINEVSNASSELFGGSNVSIPSDGAHGGQSGWQSNNAWDIKATIGTPVYAVIGGTLKTYTDYGPTPIKKDGKTLFGAGFTVDSDDGLPDVYYTHLKDVTVKQGDKVTCGQLLGYVMDFPGSDYDHLHIGVESGNVRQFLNDNGTLKCANGQSISGTTVTGNSSETAYNAATSTSGAVTAKSDSVFDAPNVDKDDYLVQMGKSIASKFLKTENVDEQILSIYEDILTNNKNILSELELVQLNDTSYSNLKYDSDGTQFDSVNKPLLDDLDAASKAAGITTTITTASTGHSIKTKTGNTSRHGQQTAVDIAILNGVGAGGATNASNGNAEFRSLGTKLANALVSMGYTLNTESGNSKAVLWQTNTGGNHFNHLHVSNNSGESGTAPTVDSNSSETAYNAATGVQSAKSGSVFDAPNVAKDDYLVQMGKSIASKFLKTENTQLGEQKSFGRDVSNRYGRIIIPKDTNPKIKSPISGVVFNKRYSSSCTNQITIKNEDNKKFYLQFCGISSPMVRDGQSISVGDVIGKTDSDVEVTMLDGSWNTVPIGSGGIKTDSPKKDSSSGKDNKKNQSGRSSVFDSDRTPIDNITSMVSSLPAKAIDKVFGNKYDEKTGEMTQKRWGGVADEREVDPWILNFIKDPLGRKKVTENIEKIKRLLK
jgi:murein DD-endopeptidase MepM/ murein hydrolase activator NlpD